MNVPTLRLRRLSQAVESGAELAAAGVCPAAPAGPCVHSGKPRGRCSGPRGQRDLGRGPGARAFAAVPAGRPAWRQPPLHRRSPWPPRFPLVAGEEGLRAHSPPLLLRAPQPSASRSPLLSCGHGARRAGPRMGSSFRARPLPSSPTLVLRVLCLASPRPKRRPHRAALGSRGPCSGAKGRRLPWVRAPGEKAEVSQASTTRCWEREASWTSKQPCASGRETGSGPRDRKWAPGLRTAPTRTPVGPASHSTDATCHCLEPIYFVFI